MARIDTHVGISKPSRSHSRFSLVLWACVIAGAALVAILLVRRAPQTGSPPTKRETELLAKMAELQQLQLKTPEIEVQISALQTELVRDYVAPRMKSQSNHALELDVEVVDEAGIPLRGVDVHIVSNRLVGVGWRNEATEKTIRIDEAGRVSASGAGVVLYIVKAGYYRKILDFPMVIPDLAAAEFVKYAVPSKTSGLPRVRVMMEKQGIITELVRRNVEIIARTDGSGTVSSFNLPTYASALEVNDLADKSLFPDHAMFASSRLDADNLFQGVKSRPGDPNARTWYPDVLAIHAAYPGDGFIKNIVELKKSTVPRAMRTAYVDGYLNKIEFTAQEVIAARQGNLACAFYFRFDGRYGRGELAAELSEDRKNVVVWMNFRFQPDGSVNLETGE